MSSIHRWPAVAALYACALLLTGCPNDGRDGANGADGTHALVQLTPEPAGANCANGGTRIQSGIDADRDAVLDPAEVTATQYACNGAAGHAALLATTLEPVGSASCVNGGTRIQAGADLDDDGTLDAGEVTSTQYACNGSAGADGRVSLVATSVEPAGANCQYGGTRIQSGVDADGDATLDPGEAVLTQFACNGATGLASLVDLAAEPAGANCAWGGTRIASGVDVDRSGVLDAAEVTSTQFVCNGAPGLNVVVATTLEPVGANCAAGGNKVDLGLDANRNGLLDAGEETATWYACNGVAGTNGADGLTSLVVVSTVAAGVDCAAGGSRIQTGLDADRDAVLDAAEIASDQHLCNGVNGTDGVDGVTSLVAMTSLLPGDANCVYGGTRLESGLDSNRNATLEIAEVASTSYACNGADGADGLTSLFVTTQELPGGNCQYGGTRIVAGLDLNANGLLDPTEKGAPQYACNGAPGVDGSTALVSTAPDTSGSCANGGTVVQSGIDGNRNGTLDPTEVASTQYVCNGAPGADGAPGTPWLVATSPDATGTCANGGARIDAGPDANANGVLDPLEISSTAFACNGATGPSMVPLLVLTAEPAGANCPYGGTKIESGLDTNGSGVLDPSEVTATQYACNADATHPEIVAVTPTPGGSAGADSTFCAVFSEPMDPATINATSLRLAGPTGTVAANVTWDPATLSGCLDPVDPLWIGWGYTLYVGETPIRDVSGNPMLGQVWATYTIAAPNLRVTIDAIEAGATVGTWDVTFTVTNTDAGAAGPFGVGLFVDPAFTPDVGYTPDASADFAGLPGNSSQSGTIQLTAGSFGTILAFVDIFGTVAESNEWDNLGRLRPALTGPIQVSTTTVAEFEQLTVTILVNGVTRYAELMFGTEYGTTLYAGGTYGNYAGEGTITFNFTVPSGWGSYGTLSAWVNLWDQAGSSPEGYAARAYVSTTNLAHGDLWYGGPWIDSGIPLTYVTFAPSSRPNLQIAVDTITVGAGTLDVAYTVTNVGFGDAGPFDVGIFVNPAGQPTVGLPPDATAPVAALAMGGSTSGVITVSAPADARIVALADVFGAVPETVEDDNLAVLFPTLTGAVGAIPSTVEEGAQITLTIPVNQSTRFASIWLGSEYWVGPSWWLGEFPGNAAGEGVITVTVTIPAGAGMVGGTWSVWIQTLDAGRSQETLHVALPAYSATNLVKYDYRVGGWVDTGIPLTFVTVTPPTTPNLRMRLLDAVPAAGGGLDVTFLVNNVGYADAGPFTVGLFTDPPAPPTVGSPPQATHDVAGLAVGTQFTATVNVPGSVYARVLGYVDLYDAVAELNEADNVGTMIPYMTGSPVIAPNPVELTGGLTVTVPVNFGARSIEVELGSDYGIWPSWWLGSRDGNWDAQREITATFGLPNDAMLVGAWSVWVTVWDDGHVNGRRYVLDTARSPDLYSIHNASNGNPLSVSTIPVTTVSVVEATHPNLTVKLDAITAGAVPGTVDVPYAVSNETPFDAGASTLGFFVDPAREPVLGDLPTATVDVAPLPPYTSVNGTMTLSATMIDRIIAFSDVLGAVVETNEADNLAWPPPRLLGQIEATPSVVDEGTLLTVKLPVTGTAFHAEVMLGVEGMGSVNLGWVDGNWENEGFIEGTVTVPTGYTWLDLTSVWVILHDDYWRFAVQYQALASLTPVNLALYDPTPMAWIDSGVPLTYVQIVPATRPNLKVTFGTITDAGGGTFNVDYTVSNVGAGDAGAFDVGFFVDPPSIPGIGTPTSGAVTIPSLAVGASASGTVNLPATGIPAIFAYADVGGVIDEQSETDNLAYKLPAPAMTGSPVTSIGSVAVGGTVDVTVPVGPTVRKVEIYVGVDSMTGGGPAYMIGAATGNTAGEGTITANCTPPSGAAGSWYVWVATYDLYGLEWRGYGRDSTVSTINYTEWVPQANELRPTAIPLTALTITP